MSELGHLQREIQSFNVNVFNVASLELPKDLLSLGSFELLCYVESLIQRFRNFITYLFSRKRAIHSLRQSFGAKCPKELLKNIFSYLSTYEQRRATRSHRSWYPSLACEHLLYVQKPLFPNCLEIKEKYRLHVASSRSHFHCSIVTNNHYAVMADHYAGNTCYVHRFGTNVVTILNREISQVVQLNSKNELLYLEDLNSRNVIRVHQLSTCNNEVGTNLFDTESKLNNMLDSLLAALQCMDSTNDYLVGITDTGKKINRYDATVLTRFLSDNTQKKIQTYSIKVRGHFAGGFMEWKKEPYFFLWHAQKDQIAKVWNCSSWPKNDGYSFHSAKIVSWENVTERESSLYVMRLQDNCPQKYSLPFRVLSLDVNGDNQLSILALERGEDLYLHVYEIN